MKKTALIRISKKLDEYARTVGVAHKISPHYRRWGWLDGVAPVDVSAARTARTRADLRVVVDARAVYAPEGTLQGRLELIRQLRGDQKRLAKAWGVRLRPAPRAVSLP